MLIGVRAHDYGKYSIKELPLILRKEGFNTSQLVLPKAFTEIKEYKDISFENLEEIKETFEKNRIKISILGCYMDLSNPDSEVRKNATETFKKALTYGNRLGAGLVGTETAYPRLTSEEKKNWYPYMIESLSEIIEEAEKVGQNIGLEPVYRHPLENLETTVKIFDIFKSKYLKMIFDPVNVLEFTNINQNLYWKKWLDAMGDKIEALHVKDFAEKDGKYVSVALGDGVMNYKVIAEWFKTNKSDIPIIREELNPEKSEKDIGYIMNMFGNLDVDM